MSFDRILQSFMYGLLCVTLAACQGATDTLQQNAATPSDNVNSNNSTLNISNDTDLLLSDDIITDNVAPSEPSNLRLSQAPFSNQVELTWNLSVDNVQVSGYRVYRNGILQSLVSVNTFRDTTVTSGMNYTYYVEAFDASENSSTSNVLDVQTPIPVDTVDPTNPSGLSASSVTSSDATISWNRSTDDIALSGYRIYQNGVHIGTTVNPSFSVTSLAASTSYTFTVEAYDSSNNTALSNSLNVVTLAQSAARSVTLSWRAPTRNTDDSCIAALDGYILQYGNSPSTYDTSLDLPLGHGDVSCEQTGYDNACGAAVMRCTYITEVLPADDWYFAVQVYDNSGNLSALSNETLTAIN